jgi:ATP-dependent RNA helicase DOB1
MTGDAERMRWKGYDLNPFQIEAVEAIRGGHNVLVSAPTGAGKTLVAEYAIADAVAKGKRCIYTSPIKALSNQKYRDFRDDPEIDVGILTGDVTIHPTAKVLIMTTEILRNSIFEAPEHLAEVEYVIFDEVPFALTTRARVGVGESLIFAPESIRFICLSPRSRTSRAARGCARSAGPTWS